MQKMKIKCRVCKTLNPISTKHSPFDDGTLLYPDYCPPAPPFHYLKTMTIDRQLFQNILQLAKERCDRHMSYVDMLFGVWGGTMYE